MGRASWETTRFAPVATLVYAIFAAVVGWAAVTAASVPASRPADAPRYSYHAQHDPNGTGKFYMGREIALVMGHEAIPWLERRQREREEEPAQLVAALKLRRGDVVADIGAGSGYITTRLARAVGSEGRVKAVDVQPEMLDRLRKKMNAARIRNVDPVLGDEADPKLEAASIDLVLMVDVYHELAYPYEMMQAVIRALKPEGRVALVEYRMEDPKVPIKLVHKMTAAQAISEMNAAGLRLKQRNDTLPRQHILIFERQAADTQPASRASE